MTADHLLIVNPRSANGSTGRRWQQIEGVLRGVIPPFDAAFTNAPRDASRLAGEAAGRYKVIVAVGGDGTVNEAVNGLIDEQGSLRADVALGIIPRGTGADFVRSLGIPHALDEAAGVLARGQRRDMDVGRAQFRGFDGAEHTRYFINEAEVGMGAAVCQRVNRSSKRFGGAFSFLWGILVTSLRYRDRPVSFAIENEAPATVVLNNAWIANGRYSGGGIRSAPRALLDDGLLDLVRIEHAGPLRRISGMLKLRSGAFVDLPQVQYRTAHRVEATAASPVPVETDGEPVGTVPAVFDVLPARLPVIAP